MITRSLCNSCFTSFVLLVEPSEVELIKQIADEKGHTAPCPRLCGGRINLVGDSTITAMTKDRRLKDPIHLSGKELFQAVNGMGLPDEIPSSKELVQALLKSESVTKAVIEEKDGKIYLHELHLGSDTVMHLTSGLRGAQVLKITKLVKKQPKRRKHGSSSHR